MWNSRSTQMDVKSNGSQRGEWPENENYVLTDHQVAYLFLAKGSSENCHLQGQHHHAI